MPKRFTAEHKIKLAGIIRRDYLDGFGIDWAQYGAADVWMNNDGVTCQVEWKHKTSGKVIMVTEVYFNLDPVVEVLQLGTSGGDLIY